MKLYRKKDEGAAYDIIDRHGFVLTNPDEPLPRKVWTKDGISYKFDGWENTPKTALMAANPKYITMKEI